jgi:hypothetical protein
MRYDYEPIGEIKMEQALAILSRYQNMESVKIKCYEGTVSIPSEDVIIWPDSEGEESDIYGSDLTLTCDPDNDIMLLDLIFQIVPEDECQHAYWIVTDANVAYPKKISHPKKV